MFNFYGPSLNSTRKIRFYYHASTKLELLNCDFCNWCSRATHSCLRQSFLMEILQVEHPTRHLNIVSDNVIAALISLRLSFWVWGVSAFYFYLTQ
jgi:hypothetical protein